MKIGEVARRTGLTERTLRYYEERGLVDPPRQGGGHRVYDGPTLERLYRVMLLRELGTPLDEIPRTGDDLLTTVRRHLADIDSRVARLARTRERVRSTEELLEREETPTDEHLLAMLSGIGSEEPALTRRLTLLVYRDLEAAAAYLVDTFGFTPGPLTRDDSGRVVHAEVHAGDGLIWMHRETPDFGLASPSTLGGATACMAVSVDDAVAHHERSVAAGATVVYPPTAMPYGVLEYCARDPEGVLWSFMQPKEGTTHE